MHIIMAHMVYGAYKIRNSDKTYVFPVVVSYTVNNNIDNTYADVLSMIIISDSIRVRGILIIINGNSFHDHAHDHVKLHCCDLLLLIHGVYNSANKNYFRLVSRLLSSSVVEIHEINNTYG